MSDSRIHITVTFSLDSDADSGTVWSALAALAGAADGAYPAGVIVESATIVETGYDMAALLADINAEAHAALAACERCDRDIFRPAPGAPSSAYYCPACRVECGD